jgi:hypothetical protein
MNILNQGLKESSKQITILPIIEQKIVGELGMPLLGRIIKHVYKNG